MTPSLRHIVYDIKHIYETSSPSDDMKLSIRQIEFEVLTYRSLWIRRDLDVGRTNFLHFGQTIPCFELEDAGVVACCNETVTCKLMKSIQKIPGLVRTKSITPIIITSIDDSKDITLENSFAIKYLVSSQYTGRERRAFIENDYLKIINDKFIKRVKILGIFDDPRELARINSCDGNSCYDVDAPFPLSMDLVPLIRDSILKNELNIQRQSQPDNENDNK